MRWKRKRMPKLLSYDDYRTLTHDVPYFLTLQTPRAHLFYFGEAHSFDPEHPQWTEHRSYWERFLAKTNGAHRVVFVEGGMRPVEATYEEAILKHGGMGLTTKLAHDAGVAVESPEPPYELEYQELEKQFSHQEIAYYYFARVVHQWLNHGEPRPEYDTYLSAYLTRDKVESGWTDIEYTPEGLAAVHESLFGTTFNKFDEHFLYTQINPVDSSTRGGQVARASSVVRDAYIANRIVEKLKSGTSVFAHFGCSHVVIQEPFLREALDAVQ